MIIDGRKIGPGQPPYIVAEMSGNHCGDYNKMGYLMGLALGAGADAVKIQCYTPDTITLDSWNDDFIIKDGPWKNKRLYDLYKKTHTPLEWLPDLFAMASRYGFTLFASAFDKTSVDILEKLKCPAYKIASMEIVDIPLIEYVASKGKPMILSTGMATVDEIHCALSAASTIPCATLHCVSGYPAEIGEYNLQDMKRYTKICGISDHTTGWEIPVAVTALGAHIIEKHICISRKDDTEDAAFSLEPEEFKKMTEAVKAIYKATHESPAPSEQSSFQLRRSLYITADMKVGDVFTEANVRSIRPGYGMAPKELPNVLGKTAACDIEKGEALTREMFEV